jgi:hypothetical protein
MKYALNVDHEEQITLDARWESLTWSFLNVNDWFVHSFEDTIRVAVHVCEYNST